jgi:hypothetical protein
MEKVDKVPRAEVMAFYHGGAKFHAATTYTKVELETRIENAMSNGSKFVKVDTVNEDKSIADDSLTMLFDRMLFYTVLEKLPPSLLVKPDNNIKVVS